MAATSARSTVVTLFFRRFSISWRFALLLILFSIFVGGVVTVFYLGLKQVLDHNVLAAQNIMLAGQKEKLAVASDSLAFSIAEAIKDEADPAKKIELIRKMVDPIRFEDDKSGYYFVYENTTNVALPIRKESQGKDLAETKDKNGIFFVRDLMSKAKVGGGFVEYIFPKPNQGDQPKLAYAKMIPGTNMWIGTGVYIDNVEREKAKIRTESEERIRTILTQIFTGIGISLVVLILLSALIIATISGPIREATEAAIRCAKGDLDIKLDAQGNDEAARMQAALNTMVETLRSNIMDIETKTLDAQDKARAADEARKMAEDAMGKAEQAPLRRHGPGGKSARNGGRAYRFSHGGHFPAIRRYSYPLRGAERTHQGDGQQHGPDVGRGDGCGPQRFRRFHAGRAGQEHGPGRTQGGGRVHTRHAPGRRPGQGPQNQHWTTWAGAPRTSTAS